MRDHESAGSRIGRARALPTFVGRARELDWLERRLQHAIEGRPQLVSINGEAGIGKTRLLRELQTMARHSRVRLAAGRCAEDVARPYGAFVEGLFPLLARAGDEALAPFLKQHLGATADAEGPSLAAEHNKLRLFVHLAGATIRLAQETPLLVVLDDLHWADHASLDLLCHLAFGAADAADEQRVPLMIVAAHRPPEPAQPLARALTRLQAEPIFESLELAGLGDDEIVELLQGLDLAEPSQQFVANVREATQGNPLFVQEALHHLEAEGALEHRGESLVVGAAAPDMRFPEHLVGAIAARIQGMAEPNRQVLAVAALLGDQFSHDTLRAVCAPSDDEVAEALADGERHRLLLADDNGFQFAHPLIRHVFATHPDADERAALHARIATTLEGLLDGDAHVVELAHHFIAAGTAAPPEKTVAYARRAGDQAFALYAASEAAHYYEAALAAAEGAGILDLTQRGELHFRAGLARYRSMDPGPSIREYQHAVAAFRSAGNVQGLAQALMELAHVRFSLAAVPYGTLIDVRELEGLLPQLADQPALLGRICAILSEVYCHARQPEPATAMAQQALGIGEQIGDETIRAHGYVGLAWAQSQGLCITEALDSYQQSLDATRRAGNRWFEAVPIHRMPLLLTWLGRLDEAEAIAIEAGEISRKTQDSAEYSWVLAALTHTAVARGDFAAAEQHAHNAMVMVSRSRYPWGGFAALSALGCARALRGAWPEAHDAIAMLVEPGRCFDEVGPVFQAVAWAYESLVQAYANPRIEGADALVAGLSAAIAQAGTEVFLFPAVCAAAELGDLLAAPALAAQAYELIAVGAAHGMQFPNWWVFLVPRVLGVAAMANHWWDRAEAHFQTAIETGAACGARAELGRAHLDYGRMLAARDAAGDRDAGIEQARRALGLCEELGMVPFARQAAALAQHFGEPLVIAAPPDAYPGGLIEREAEILVLLAHGRSDGAIADALLLRPSTLAHYIESIGQKVGTSARPDLIAYASTSGLVAQLPVATRGSHGFDDFDARVAKPHRPLPSAQPVAILFTDMEGSTALLQRLGDHKAQDLLRTHNTIIRTCLQRHHGVEIKHTGDGIMASFTSPAAAVACAIAMQRGIAMHNGGHPNDPIQVRIGLNAGEPIAEEGQLFGSAVNAAARICSHAAPGQILVSNLIRQLTASTGYTFVDRGHAELKGFSGRFQLYEVPWEEFPRRARS